MLRNDWCRDREPVYDVLHEIGRATVVRPPESTERVLASIRSALSDGLDVYLADLDSPAADAWPSLIALCEGIKPREI